MLGARVPQKASDRKRGEALISSSGNAGSPLPLYAIWRFSPAEIFEGVTTLSMM